MSGRNWNPTHKKRREVSANADSRAHNTVSHAYFKEFMDDLTQDVRERLRQIQAAAAERYGRRCTNCDLHLETKTLARRHWEEFPMCKMAHLHEK